jgi:1-hydroxycarotenoid 3,4-desaturase
VLSSSDYRAEFDAAAERTLCVCAQDRGDRDASVPGPQRLLQLVNAPATGDSRAFTPMEIEGCRDRAFSLLRSCGVRLRPAAEWVATSPTEFDRLFPGTGGALYGPAVHGPMATSRRPGSRSAIPGLYLAAGSTHPGTGVPMAALSGRLAASAVMADLGSTSTFHAMATRGGTSTRSATTGSTA